MVKVCLCVIIVVEKKKRNLMKNNAIRSCFHPNPNYQNYQTFLFPVEHDIIKQT